MAKLEGKVAVVTGAASGMGKAIAQMKKFGSDAEGAIVIPVKKYYSDT